MEIFNLMDDISSSDYESFNTSVGSILDNLIDSIEASRENVIECNTKEQHTIEKEESEEDDIVLVAEFPPPISQQDEPRCDLDESVEYIVKDILDKRTDRNGVTKYLVSWEGYSKNENTWEPVENLLDCDKAMHKFELMRADKLARKYHKSLNSKVGENDRQLNNSDKDKHKEYKVKEIRGISKINDIKYFLLRLDNTKEPAFIRASLANQLFPSKVIDFYMHHLKMRH